MTPIQPPVFIRLTETEGKRPFVIRPADIHSMTQGDAATCINFRVESFVAEKYTLKQIYVTETVDEIAAKLNVGKMHIDPTELPQFHIHSDDPTEQSFVSWLVDNAKKEGVPIAVNSSYINPEKEAQAEARNPDFSNAKLTQCGMTTACLAGLCALINETDPDLANRLDAAIEEWND